jgi:hypothetical protein
VARGSQLDLEAFVSVCVTIVIVALALVGGTVAMQAIWWMVGNR